jgi:ADP-ribosylation factor protein 1
MSIFSGWFDGWFSFGERKEYKMLFMALDSAGKTTILYKLTTGETVDTFPSAGFNVVPLKYKGVDLSFWDIGGCQSRRPMWRHYHLNTQGLIFVIDASDKDRLGEGEERGYYTARGLFIETLKDPDLLNTKVLIFLNKQDLSGALSVEEFKGRFRLDDLFEENSGLLTPHQYHIQPCCARSGEGLKEGLDWLIRVFREDG